MNQKILITGIDSELKSKLVKQFLDNNYAVAVSTTGKNIKTKNSRLIEVPWNNRSPLSAKDLILECQNRLGGIDHALTILSAQHNNKPIHEISSSDIESAIDISLKGTLFLLKEIILYFQKKGSGNISLIHNLDQSKILAPLYAIGAGGLSKLGESLFASYQNELLSINSFTSHSEEIQDYAEYIYRNISSRTKEVHGKNFKFQEKNMPFSFIMQKR